MTPVGGGFDGASLTDVRLCSYQNKRGESTWAVDVHVNRLLVVL